MKLVSRQYVYVYRGFSRSSPTHTCTTHWNVESELIVIYFGKTTTDSTVDDQFF